MCTLHYEEPMIVIVWCDNNQIINAFERKVLGANLLIQLLELSFNDVTGKL